MAYLFAFVTVLASWLPSLAWAEEGPTGSYRGIATIYYTLIWVVLSYGLYDSFGRRALYIGAPIIAVIIYFALPSA
ncbi:MAG TPA: hypothetical protein VJ746_12570 [Nitrospira sp.]|nr:hypothetical protein [Nitrospira sp.]